MLTPSPRLDSIVFTLFFLLSICSAIGCGGSDLQDQAGSSSSDSRPADSGGIPSLPSTGSGAGQATGGSTPCYENIDIVFALDVSTSMGFILQTLENEIGKVWQTAASLDDAPHLGLVVFVDDFTVASAQPYASMAALQADFARWYNHTASNEQTHSSAQNLDFPENSLDALFAAAGQFAWRDARNTLRVIIHATDDTFLEAPAAFQSGVPATHTYVQAVTELTKGMIRVASFAAHQGGPSEMDNVEPGFFTPRQGQPAIPEATHGKIFDILQVENGSISLTQSINDFVIRESCVIRIPED